DHAGDIAQEARTVFTLDDNRRAEDILALQFRPVHGDTTLWLPFEQMAKVRTIGAVNHHPLAACDEAAKFVARQRIAAVGQARQHAEDALHARAHLTLACGRRRWRLCWRRLDRRVELESLTQLWNQHRDTEFLTAKRCQQRLRV